VYRKREREAENNKEILQSSDGEQQMLSPTNRA
jgi:hypothetical protein